MYSDEFNVADSSEDKINKDWLKASAASLAKLNDVGSKVYSIGLADSKKIKVNKHNLLSQPGSTSSHNSEYKKSAWGSNGSIPELLRKQDERIRQNKKMRPSSAVVGNQTTPTRTRQRPHSAKEINTDRNKKPPSGLGVKGTHRNLDDRPPGGIGVGAGSGWTAPPGGILGMSGAEIDDVLNQVSKTQNRYQNGVASAHRPPSGRKVFNNDYCRTTFGDIVDVFEDGEDVLPSDILYRPPPEPIHVTMPTAMLDSDEDEDDEPQYQHGRFYDEKQGRSAGGKSKSHKDISFSDDLEPWDDFLDEESGGRRSSRLVTFNEDMNQTTLITPRDGNKDPGSDSDTTDYDTDTDIHQTYHDRQPIHRSPQQQQSSQINNKIPKPKLYIGRPELRHVKGRTNSGIEFNQDINVKSKGSKLHSSINEQFQSVPTVSVAYIDDLLPDQQPKSPEFSQKKDKPKMKSKRSVNREDVETMMSRITVTEMEQKKVKSEQNQNKDGELWAPSGSQTIKCVSSDTNKNYYELALDAKIAKNRLLHQGLLEDKKKTKTIKTWEFGDGEVVEHRSVSSVDAHIHNKKEYVVPQEARPHSATRKKTPDIAGSPRIEKEDLKLKNKIEESKYEHLTFDSIGFSHKDRERRLSTDSATSTHSTKAASQHSEPAVHGTTDARPKSAVSSKQSKKTDETRKSEDISKSHVKHDEPTITNGKANSLKDELYGEYESRRLNLIKKSRASSAPVRYGPTLVNGKLSDGGKKQHLSPYSAVPVKPRPYSASVLTEMKNREKNKGLTPPNQSSIKISTKLSFREVKRNKSAVKALKKGTINQQRNYNEDKYYANYTRPPPKTFVPAIRLKKMAERQSARKAEAEKQESKEPEVIEIWTRKDDFEIETEGISDCKRLQDKLLDQGVPVTLDTLTRALLPPNECALRGNSIVTNTKPSLPDESSRLLSKPSVWCPDEYNRLQRAKKAAQRADQSLRDQEGEERNRLYLLSMSASTVGKRPKKKSNKKKK